jgi:hypothetical protein
VLDHPILSDEESYCIQINFILFKSIVSNNQEMHEPKEKKKQQFAHGKAQSASSEPWPSCMPKEKEINPRLR